MPEKMVDAQTQGRQGAKNGDLSGFVLANRPVSFGGHDSNSSARLAQRCREPHLLSVTVRYQILKVAGAIRFACMPKSVSVRVGWEYGTPCPRIPEHLLSWTGLRRAVPGCLAMPLNRRATIARIVASAPIGSIAHFPVLAGGTLVSHEWSCPITPSRRIRILVGPRPVCQC